MTTRAAIGLIHLGAALVSDGSWAPALARTRSGEGVRVSSAVFTRGVEYDMGTVDVLATITNIGSQPLRDIVVRLDSLQVDRDWYPGGISWRRGSGMWMGAPERPLGRWHLGRVRAGGWVRIFMGLVPNRVGRVPFSIRLLDDHEIALKGGWLSGQVKIRPRVP